MLEQFDTLIKQRSALKSWWSLGSKVAAYDRVKHTLRVDVQKPSLVAFCGQEYAGAQNYHDAPTFFVEALKTELNKHANEIAKLAYEKELARLDGEIEKHKNAVMIILEESIKNE